MGISEDVSWLYAIIVLQDFQNYQDHSFPILHHFLRCFCDLLMEHFDAHSSLFHNI